MILVVKICENTLRKRLQEFASTPSGNLTVTEFQTLWLEEERDPPSYTRSREKKHHQSFALAAGSATSAATPSQMISAIKGESSHSEETLVNPETLGEPNLEKKGKTSQEVQEDNTTVVEDDDEEEELQEAMKEMLDILESEDAEQLEKSLRNDPESQDANLSDLDEDLEVQNMLAVTEEEIEFKTMLWMNENHDWLQSQERMYLLNSSHNW